MGLLPSPPLSCPGLQNRPLSAAKTQRGLTKPESKAGEGASQASISFVDIAVCLAVAAPGCRWLGLAVFEGLTQIPQEGRQREAARPPQSSPSLSYVTTAKFPL